MMTASRVGYASRTFSGARTLAGTRCVPYGYTLSSRPNDARMAGCALSACRPMVNCLKILPMLERSA